MNVLPGLELQPVGPLWMEVGVFAVALAALGFSIYATKHQAPKQRLIVGVLRTLLIATGLLLLHNPTFVRQTVVPQEQRLAVLVDRSGSMGAESEGETTRYEKAFEVVAQLQSQDLAMDVFEFDNSLSEPLGNAARPRKLSGNKTDFHGALNQLLTTRDDYTSVLLLSDGHDLGRFSQMSADETKAWFERLNAPPVNAVLTGRESSGPEVAIHSIDAPAFSFVRAPVVIRATVIVRNLDGFNTQVQLLQEGKVIQIQDLVLDEQGFGTVEFQHYPEEEGEHLFTVAVPPHHLEKNVENNRQQVLIDIGRDKINVLHIAGAITWDLQGLRAMFERDPLVDLTAFYIMRTREHVQVGVDNRQIPHDEMALVPFPTEEIFDRQLFTFDVVVFHDFDAGTYFSDSYQARRLMSKIKEFVTEHRGGFIVVGGPRTASGPSLGLTPLAEILPLKPSIQRRPYDRDLRAPALTDAGALHPVLRQFEADSQVFDGSMDGLTIDPDADILLEDDSGHPLLAVAEAGTGRTMFLNTSSSWKWRRDAIAEGAPAERYYDFWSQTLKWAIQDPALNQVRLSATRLAGNPLAVDIDALLRDRNYAPLRNTNATLQVTPLDGRSEPVELTLQTDSNGSARASYSADRPGYYRLALTDEGLQDLSRPVTVFLGGSQVELRNTDLVPETLQRLSAVTGGRFVSAANQFRAANLVWGEAQQQTIVETQRSKLRNWIWILPLLLLIAGIEWTIRRSSHLA